MATTDGDDANTLLDDIASRAPSDITVPPRPVRKSIELTAGYVARNGQAYEARIRDQGVQLPFLDPENPYYAYYQWRKEDLRSGGGSNALAAGRANEVSFQGKDRKGPEKPEDFQFSARMPQINAQDLEVIKLTALFVAKNGRSWMTQLSQREAGNPQFSFLRPQHTFHQYFSRLLDQYTDLLSGDSIENSRPQKKRIVQLEENVKDKAHILERARKRSEYVKYQEAQQVAKEEKEDKEKVAYAQIDWHDFVVVETVIFDEKDVQMDLPPPTSLNDLQSASLEQKAAMSIDPSRRLEEGFPSFDTQDAFYGQQPAQPGPPQYGQHVPVQPPQVQAFQPQPTDPYSRMSSLQADRERVRAAQEAAASQASMKIRSDHIPRAQAKKASQNTMLCPNCKQAIPANEIEEHMRIELLDPRWREQSKIAQQRSSTTNLSTADVAANLKRLASQRQDVFDPITGRSIEPERDAKRVPPPEGIQQNSTNVQEQIQRLHQKFGGQ